MWRTVVAFAGGTLGRVTIALGGGGEQTCSYHQWRRSIHCNGQVRRCVVTGPRRDPKSVVFR